MYHTHEYTCDSSWQSFIYFQLQKFRFSAQLRHGVSVHGFVLCCFLSARIFNNLSCSLLFALSQISIYRCFILSIAVRIAQQAIPSKRRRVYYVFYPSIQDVHRGRCHCFSAAAAATLHYFNSIWQKKSLSTQQGREREFEWKREWERAHKSDRAKTRKQRTHKL